MVEGVVAHPTEPRVTLGDRIDAILTHRLWGTLVLAAVMVLVFQSVFTWAAVPMAGIDAAVGALAGLVEAHLPEGPCAACWPTA